VQLISAELRSRLRTCARHAHDRHVCWSRLIYITSSSLRLASSRVSDFVMPRDRQPPRGTRVSVIESRTDSPSGRSRTVAGSSLALPTSASIAGVLGCLQLDATSPQARRVWRGLSRAAPRRGVGRYPVRRAANVDHSSPRATGSVSSSSSVRMASASARIAATFALVSDCAANTSYTSSQLGKRSVLPQRGHRVPPC
jgi:hypothetical protein